MSIPLMMQQESRMAYGTADEILSVLVAENRFLGNLTRTGTSLSTLGPA